MRKPEEEHSKSKKTKPTETDVTIQVGIMAGTELKPKKGSNLPIKVSASIDADALLAVALEKHCRFNKDLIKRDREYKLLYPDKSIVAMLPGVQEKFSLLRYKEELGKPYSRIVFFICDLKDVASEKIKELRSVIEDDDNFDDEELDDLHMPISENKVQTIIIPNKHGSISTRLKPPASCTVTEDKVQCPSCNLFFHCSEIEAHADSCAESQVSIRNEVFQQFYDDNVFQSVIQNDDPEEVNNVASEMIEIPPASNGNGLSVKDIAKNVSEQISPATSQINDRKGRLFDDYVETRKKFPWFKTNGQIKVTFMGEPAIDTGGPKREFLSGMYVHDYHWQHYRCFYYSSVMNILIRLYSHDPFTE